MRAAYSGFLAWACFLTPLAAGEWSVDERENPAGPGRIVLVRHREDPVASLVFGSGQMKPFLHVYGAEGELLTNPGLDREGRTTGQFPHHRGIFIGWKIESDLGTWDLWHMNRAGSIDVTGFERREARADGAELVARTVWRAGRKDEGGDDRLLEETRRMNFSRPADRTTQVDIQFELRAARDVRLAGDLQHSGVHFRAANSVAEAKNRTSYLQEPAGVVQGNDLKWCRLEFPLGERWYGVQEMNAPSNPVQELSMRDYGRFGYFFKRALKKGETLELRYRFVIDETEAPARGNKPSDEQENQWKTLASERYEAFVKSLD